MAVSPKKVKPGWFWDLLVKERGVDKRGVLNPLSEELHHRRAVMGQRTRALKPGLAGADARVYEDG